MPTHYDTTYTTQNLPPLAPHAAFDNCTFEGLNLEGSNLRQCRFVDCTFIACNLSNATLTATQIQDTQFTSCKMIGIRFDACEPMLLSPRFYDCKLDFSVFTGLSLAKCPFDSSSLIEVDFSEAVLSEASFDQCDLARATFRNTDLRKADFRTAYHFDIDPQANRMAAARFARLNLAGLLHRFQLKIED